MIIPTVKSLVSGNNFVKFSRFQKGELWYQVWHNKDEGGVEYTGFDFPVPVDDTGDGVFMAEDKALLFMRYIRKHIGYLQSASN